MRALFEDAAFADRDFASFRIEEIGLDVEDTEKQDLFIRVTKAANDPIEITAYATREEAHAGAGTAIETWDVDTYPIAGTVTGDVLGVVLKLAGDVADADELDAVWIYTCAPDLVAMDNIRDLLREYTASGAVLEDFDADNIISGDLPAASPDHEIRVFTERMEREFQRDVSILAGPTDFQIVVAIRHASIEDADSDGAVREGVFRRVRLWQARVESILADERRNDLTISAALGGSNAAWHWIESVPPIPVEEPDGHFMIAMSRFAFRVESMWTDYQYPRA